MMRSLRLCPLLAVALVLAACGTTKQPSPSGGGGGSGGGTGPLAIAYSLESANAASAQVTAAGGTLTTKAADGTVYTLTVPANALAVSTKLTMTPLKNVLIEGQGASWETGVQLAPQGTQFLHPVTLEIDTANASAVNAAIALVTSDGTRYVPQAAGTTGTTFTAQLDHFSDYLVGPVTPTILGDAIQAMLGNLASPPTTDDVQSLITLWVEAQNSALATLRDRLDKEIAAEIASLTTQQQNDQNPTAGMVSGSLSASAEAGNAGRSADAKTLQDNASYVFATLMRVLQLDRLQAGYTIASLEPLVPRLAQAMAIAKADPIVLQGGSVIDPQSEATALVGRIVDSADYDCNHAYFGAGITGLQDATGAVNLLALTTPTVSDLQADENTCVPPVFTGMALPANIVYASADWVPSSGAGTTQTDTQPPAATTVTSTSTITATASNSYASAKLTLVVDSGAGGTTASISVDANDQTSTTTTQDLANAGTAINGGNLTALDFAFDHARADYQVTLTWNVPAAATSGRANGGLSFDNGGSASGSTTIHSQGLGYTYSLGYPIPAGGFKGAVPADITMTGGAKSDQVAQSSSFSVKGTMTIKIQPDPNGTVE